MTLHAHDGRNLGAISEDIAARRTAEMLKARAVARRVMLALLVGQGVCMAMIALLLFTRPAPAHDALPSASHPRGWSYPFSCCAGHDCREVGASLSGARITVAEIPEGYRISSTGEVIAYGDTRIKDSPDGAFHWCSVAGADDSRTICLFVPPRSF